MRRLNLNGIPDKTEGRGRQTGEQDRIVESRKADEYFDCCFVAWKNSQEFAYLRNDSTSNPLDENEKRIRELEQENEKIRHDNRALLDALALATDKQHSSDEPLTA